MLYLCTETKNKGGEEPMLQRIRPQAPDSPDIDDLIFEGEHLESEK